MKPQRTNKCEIEKFSRDAPRWWDEAGPFAPLHRMNPVRLGYIKRRICAHYTRDPESLHSFDDLNILDIGCGGGLVCEPLTRLGACVTGIDADPVAIDVAKEHAQISGLEIEYKNTMAESLLPPPTPPQAGGKEEARPLEGGEAYDIILALEIVEHVTNLEDFVSTCAKLLKPGGLLIFSTLNRTPKSFALGIVAAEYILRRVPRGTHHWKQFVKPSELAAAARQSGLTPQDITGLIFNPLANDFMLSDTDMDVNYFMISVKEP